MKSLALLPIVGALTLYGSAFFGIWTAPGLENLPTYEVVSKEIPWKAFATPAPLAGIIPVSALHQYQPEGVTCDWGDRPFIALSAPNPKESRRKAAKAIAAADAMAEANARVAKAAVARTKALPPPRTVLPSSPFPPAISVAGGASSRGSGSGGAGRSSWGSGGTVSTSGGGASNPRSPRSSQKRAGVTRSSGPRAGRGVSVSFGGR